MDTHPFLIFHYQFSITPASRIGMIHRRWSHKVTAANAESRIAWSQSNALRDAQKICIFAAQLRIIFFETLLINHNDKI